MKRIIALAMAATAMLTASAMAAEAPAMNGTATSSAVVRSSQYVSRAVAYANRTSSTSFRVNCVAKAYQTVDTLGISRITVYDVTAGTTRTYSGTYQYDTSNYDVNVDISGTTGHSYYVTVDFFIQTYAGNSEHIYATSGTVKL